MTLRYFANEQGQIAASESDRTAAALLARGYTECSHFYYSALWAVKNAHRQAELVREDKQ